MTDPIQSRELRGAVWKAARERIYALAGDGQGRMRAQPGKIWVRIPGVGLTVAWSIRFMPRHDQPVWLERRPEDGSLEVVDQWLSEAAQPMPMILPHRSMHEEGGSDPIQVTPGMIQPLRVYPTDPPGRAVFVARGMVIRGDGSVVEAGGGSVPLNGFEDGEVAWIVVRDGMVQAARELQPMDIPLAEVTVSDAVTFLAIRDRRQFVSPWVSVSTSDIRLSGDVEGPGNATRVTRLQGKPVDAANPNANDALIWDAVAGTWRPGMPPVSLSGDVDGPGNATRVTRLQGRPVADQNPNPNDVLTWDGTAGMWKPAPPPGGGGGGGGGTSGPWVLRALYNPQFPNTSMFPVRIGFTNETFQDVPGGLGILFARMTNAGGFGWILRLKEIPTLPVRVICGFSDLAPSQLDREVGLVMYHQGSGKIISASCFKDSIRVARWNSISSWNSTPWGEANSRHRLNLVFGFDITSTGYSVFYSIMPGLTMTVVSEGFSFFGGPPTHIGIGVSNSGSPGAGWFWHWEEVAL